MIKLLGEIAGMEIGGVEGDGFGSDFFLHIEKLKFEGKPVGNGSDIPKNVLAPIAAVS